MECQPGRPRPWLDHYDYWVPHHTNYPRRPLYEILRRAAAEGRDLPALRRFSAPTSRFGELKDQADRLATALARHGIVKGDRVGIMLPNCPQYLIGVFAVLRLGAIVVNINPAYTRAGGRAPRARLGHPDADHARSAGAGAATPLRSVTNLETIIITSLSEYSPEATPPAADRQARIRLADLLAESDDRSICHASSSIPTMTWRCCNTPAARPACRRRRC